jgi:multidrug efflux pump subunit AcrA (membrane-fusion protein)
MVLSKRSILLLAVVPLFLLASLALSQAPKTAAPSAAPTDGVSPNVKVQRGPLEMVINLKGTFVASESHEIAVKMEAWGTGLTGGGLVVEKAVPHGATANKGDVLVTFQTDKIDKAIKELEADLKVAELTMKLARDELPMLEKSTPMDLAAAERAKQHADEDLKKWIEVDRPQMALAADVFLKDFEHMLEYAKEELKQLEKMYRSKDLTEETEEIILKRHRRQVERAEYGLKTQQIARDRVIKVDIPRRDQSMHESATRAAMALDKARSTLPVALEQKRLALAKQESEHQKTVTRLENLRKDRELMTVKAPAAGIVYHGKYANGQWNTATVTTRLVHNGSVQGDEAFMTILTPGPMTVHTTFEEKDVHWIKKGLRGKAIPVGLPDVRLPVEVESVPTAPQGGGTFPLVLKVDAANPVEGVLPGMSCTIKLVAYRKDVALTLPASAVFSDDDETHYVYRAGSKDKTAVQVGKTVGERTEVLAPLKEGDEVLRTKP